MTSPPTAWVLTDGKAGDEQPCLGVAQSLGLSPEIRHVAPRRPFAWFMPWGPVDPRERPGAPGSPLSPPFPDLLIASGRRAVPALRAVRKASGSRTYTVFLKDPRTGTGTADLIWVPEHDRLRGRNVVATLTPPHGISQARLAQARANPDPRLLRLPPPRAAVMVGGDSRHHRFTPRDIASLVDRLARLAGTGVSLMVTSSRRTPPPLRDSLARLVENTGGFLWDGSGSNPYVAFLALADALVLTADSFNMVGEATVTGTPILVFEPSGGHRKLRAFLDGLAAHGAVQPFRGVLEGGRYEPLNATSIVARAIARDLTRHRRALGLSEPVLPEIA